jgi:hypothetical protein
MDKEKIIKELLKKKIINEQVRYDVSTMLSYYPEKVNKHLKKLGITEDEFSECIKEYSGKRKIFFFATMTKQWDDVAFKIDDQIIESIKK